MRTTPKYLSMFALLGAAACASSSGGTMESPAPSQPAATTQVAAPAAAEPEPEAASELSFTRAQANRGRDAFNSACTTCHYSSEFSDQQFKFSWRRRTAGDLYELVATSMPEDAPGSLPPQQYADIIAYFLSMNGMDAGSAELPADAEALQGLSLAPFGGD